MFQDWAEAHPGGVLFILFALLAGYFFLAAFLNRDWFFDRDGKWMIPWLAVVLGAACLLFGWYVAKP